MLNYKKIPYKTCWLEFPDIKPTFERLGIEHTLKDEKGQPYYTVPAITDSSTSTIIHVSDTWNIAMYLEKKYPDPPLFPPSSGSLGLQKFFKDGASELLAPDGVFVPFMLPGTYDLLKEPSQIFFKETREKWYGKKIEECSPAEGSKEMDDALKLARKRFDQLDGYFGEKASSEDGSLVMGNGQIVYADFVIGSMLVWIKASCASSLWPHVIKWHDGKWEMFLNALVEKYGQVV